MSSVQCLPALERYATQSTSDSSDSTWYQKETPKRRTLYLCKRCLPHRNREHASHNDRAPIRDSIHTERVYNSNHQVGNHGGSTCRHQIPTVSLTEQDLDVSMGTCRDSTRRLGTKFKGLLNSEDDSPCDPTHTTPTTHSRLINLIADTFETNTSTYGYFSNGCFKSNIGCKVLILYSTTRF